MFNVECGSSYDGGGEEEQQAVEFPQVLASRA